MGKNRVFFPQMALDLWLGEGKVDLSSDELTILAEARRYRILEAARILREVTGLPDTHELVGKVKTRGFLSELGAELLETSMILGDNAYDVVPGFLGAPIGSFEEHLAGPARAEARKSLRDLDPQRLPPAPPASDEDLLARFLLEGL
jgi:hypothetical protein